MYTYIFIYMYLYVHMSSGMCPVGLPYTHAAELLCKPQLSIMWQGIYFW